MTKMFVFLQTYFASRDEHEDRGATMVEYGLMVVGIAVVVAAAALALGGRISDLFDGVIPG